MSELGLLKPPYPVGHCANEDCADPNFSVGENVWKPAYLYRDLESGKLVVFCEDCARYAELNAPERFMVIAL